MTPCWSRGRPSRSTPIVTATQEAMAEASEAVLDGFRLRSEARVVRWPDRYMDERGREFWGRSWACSRRSARLPSPNPFPLDRRLAFVATELECDRCAAPIDDRRGCIGAFS